MILARDVSNYTVDPLPLGLWRSQGVGLVIIQAFPPTYRQYQQQLRQMRQCANEGMPFDNYIYDYLATPGWRASAASGLRTLANNGFVARRLWADEEDVSVQYGQSYSVQLINNSLRDMDTVPTKLGLTGIYTGLWWWTGSRYVNNYQGFSDRPLWDSDYDNIIDTEKSWSPYGGWTYRAIKQYAGSQPDGTDLNVLSVDEAQSLNPVEEPTAMAIRVGQGLADHMTSMDDVPLFGHKFYVESDDDGNQYQVEEVYGSYGRYVSSNSSGSWVNAGPF